MVFKGSYYTPKQREEFYALFGQPITKYWEGPYFGLALGRFDDEVVQSGERAMSAVITERFGVRAAALIAELIHA